MSRRLKREGTDPLTRKAVSYSRYSTDLQNERSIEDQEALIRRYAAINGLTLDRCYSDAAQSGASILGRDSLLQLLSDAKAGAFEVVIVEELDRLSRDMEDLAGIHKRLSFAGVEIMAVHEGVASTVTVGLRGLVGQLFREDNARKIRRGLSGRVSQGLSAGGRAFGYRPHPNEKGRLLIQEEEAVVIRRIFREFSEGRSPIDIAVNLTRDGCPMPRSATAWQSSTIYGWAERRSGILRNDLYAGRIVWNKSKMVKDPETGRRVSRPNQQCDWQITDAPDLRIIEQDLWEKVQAMIEPKPHATQSDRAKMRRPVRPLSGLLRCGACGGGMSAKGKDKSGRTRIECTRHSSSRSCPAPRTWYLDLVEEAVIGLLRRELDKPDLLKLYVAEYNRARAEFAAANVQRRGKMERRIHQLDSEISRLVQFVTRGIGDTDRIAHEYEAKCAELTDAKLELSLEPPPLSAVTLHPMAMEGYRKDLLTLAPIMGADHSGGSASFASTLRKLIESVTVSETAAGQMEVIVTGHLRALIDAPRMSRKHSGGTMVAEEGFEPPTQGL
ncbi:recombinase family protein [Paracoccus aminophilus]|uniref:Phage integrase n=1 Tax=Paracoccus aminophilus JCM 7686 TaxID=1367847 RepID=S5YES9_PARAH|nr:phage integrase [Paracoccus aminophilus JCM 7686]